MSSHITVLRTEAVSALNIQPKGVIVDATFGAGGHSEAIASALGANGTLVALDVDPTAFTGAAERFAAYAPTTHFLTGNFSDIDTHLQSVGVTAVDGILADLGWRTEQFEESGKGFSFSKDEPLLMTLGEPDDYVCTAGDIVNEWDEADIANVIYAYGEERAARRIAGAIVAARKETPITTAAQLADIVEAAMPRRGNHHKKIHPATKTFQALRIAVNDEFAHLERFIAASIDLLAPGGRLAIITFHSLEDRIVKHAFRDLAHDQVVTRITKKPIISEAGERDSNPRARSAKLRVVEKL